MGREECIALTIDKRWRDVNCGYRINFACEKRGEAAAAARRAQASPSPAEGETSSVENGPVTRPKTCKSLAPVVWKKRIGSARDIGVGSNGSVWIIGANAVNSAGSFISRWNVST